MCMHGVGVDRGRRRCLGMCAFELIMDALDGVVDFHQDCIACSSEVGVWTRHKKIAWHFECGRLIDGSKFGQEHSIQHVVVISAMAAEPDSTCNRDQM